MDYAALSKVYLCYTGNAFEAYKRKIRCYSCSTQMYKYCTCNIT